MGPEISPGEFVIRAGNKEILTWTKFEKRRCSRLFRTCGFDPKDKKVLSHNLGNLYHGHANQARWKQGFDKAFLRDNGV